MFIKSKRRSEKTYYSLVKSYREGSKVKHDYILYLDGLSNLPLTAHQSVLLRLEQLIVGQYIFEHEDAEIENYAQYYWGKYYKKYHDIPHGGGKLLVSGGKLTKSQEIRIDISSMEATEVREIGSDWLCYQLLEHLGVLSYINALQGWGAKDKGLLIAQLLGRLIYPCSDRKTALWAKEQSGVLNFMSALRPKAVHGQGLCRVSVKWLEEQSKFESYFYDCIVSKFSELSGAIYCPISHLYDMTNTYFEGRMQGSELAQYGRSKEKRSDAALVSMGVLTDDNGFIKRVNFYPGNVSEPSTLVDIESDLQAHPEMVVIMDAGIATVENIERLAKKKIAYLCVVRSGFKEYDIDFRGQDALSFTHHTSNGYKYQVHLVVRQYEFNIGEQDYIDDLIFVKSEAKARKDRGIWDKQKKRFEQGLLKIQSSLTKPRGHKKLHQIHQRIGRLKAKYTKVSPHFDINVQAKEEQVTQLSWTYQKPKNKQAGTYVIRSSKKVNDPKAAWEKYHQLTTVEQVNKTCKSDLNIRPIFHQKDKNIKAHLLITALACNIVTFVRNTLQIAYPQKAVPTWKEIIRIMNSQKLILSKANNLNNEVFIFSKWSKPNDKVKQVYDALKLDYMPHKGIFFKIQNKVNTQSIDSS